MKVDWKVFVTRTAEKTKTNMFNPLNVTRHMRRERIEER
jgi:hypothetical protein